MRSDNKRILRRIVNELDRCRNILTVIGWGMSPVDNISVVKRTLQENLMLLELLENKIIEERKGKK